MRSSLPEPGATGMSCVQDVNANDVYRPIGLSGVYWLSEALNGARTTGIVLQIVSLWSDKMERQNKKQ